LWLSRLEGRASATSAKSLSNVVEMRPDSLYVHSTEIRTTCESSVFGFAGSHSKPVPAREAAFLHEAEDFVVFTPTAYKYSFE